MFYNPLLTERRAYKAKELNELCLYNMFSGLMSTQSSLHFKPFSQSHSTFFSKQAAHLSYTLNTPVSTSGATWVSVCWPAALQHVDCRRIDALTFQLMDDLCLVSHKRRVLQDQRGRHQQAGFTYLMEKS